MSGFADPEAVYQLEELDQTAFAARATISFPKPGFVQGDGPCNSYTAEQSVPYPWIRIEAITATRMTCPELTKEAVFFGALQDMTLVEAWGNTLILSNDAGREMVFRVVQN